jgi:elongation factor P hydroxylase
MRHSLYIKITERRNYGDEQTLHVAIHTQEREHVVIFCEGYHGTDLNEIAEVAIADVKTYLQKFASDVNQLTP